MRRDGSQWTKIEDTLMLLSKECRPINETAISKLGFQKKQQAVFRCWLCARTKADISQAQPISSPDLSENIAPSPVEEMESRPRSHGEFSHIAKRSFIWVGQLAS